MTTGALSFALIGEHSPRVAFFVYLPRWIWLVPLPIFFWACRKWWRLVPLLSLLMIGIPGLHLGHERDGVRALRVVSWQVWYGHGDAQAILRDILAAQPDVVLLEAIGPNDEQWLRKSGFAHAVTEGQFIAASKWPLRLAAEGKWISKVSDRPWVRFEVDAPFGKVQAIAVHPHSLRETLDPRHWRRTLLHGEWSYVEDSLLDGHLGEISQQLSSNGPLAFAAGDFNTDDAGALLREHFAPFADAWASTNFGWGYTFPANARLPAWLRLDHLYAAPGLVPLRSFRLRRRDSDHAGLVIDLGLR